MKKASDEYIEQLMEAEKAGLPLADDEPVAASSATPAPRAV